jgi:1,4-dihydroxy-2-naphthoyl-CoA synthase
MINETKQTAVEWYAGRHHDVEGLRDFGAISIVEYYEELTKAVQKAKEMEKEQMMEFALAVLMEAYATVEGNVTTELTIQEYYNLKYGK